MFGTHAKLTRKIMGQGIVCANPGKVVRSNLARLFLQSSFFTFKVGLSLANAGLSLFGLEQV